MQQRSRRAFNPLWVVAIGSVLLVLFGLGLYASQRESAIAHPEQWDPRVLPYVNWVEQERGLTFDHPVYVEFLSPLEYSAYMRVDAAHLPEEMLEQVYTEESTLRSLGLIDEGINLLSASNELNDAGTLAVYSFDDRTIRVRGTHLDVDVEVTLVHELVHAAQDQHFNIGRLAHQRDSGAALAMLAMVEGDAEFTAARYLAGQSADRRAEYEATMDSYVDAIDLDLVHQPLMMMYATPYSLGPALIEWAFTQGGWPAVNELLVNPPASERELLDPLLSETGFEPVRVDPPAPRADEQVVDQADFGAIQLYFMLATRLHPRLALDAADSWAGGTYTATVTPTGQTCVTVRIRTTDESANHRLAELFEAWAGAVGSASLATPLSEPMTWGADPALRTCDPGRRSVGDGPATPPREAGQVMTMRTLVMVEQLIAGRPPSVARCTSEEVLDLVDVKILTDPTLRWSDLEGFIAGAASRCAA